MNAESTAHALLQTEVGTWDAEITIPGPNGPTRSNGSRIVRWLGNRWLVVDFQNHTGFEGHSITGFDPTKGRFVSTWVDTARPFLVVGEGDFDAASRTLTLSFQASLPGRSMTWEERTQFHADDERTYGVYVEGADGAFAESIVVRFRRRHGIG